MIKTIKNRDINLLTALERGKQKRKIDRGNMPVTILAVAGCAIVALFFVYSIQKTDEIQERLDAALSYTSNPAIMAQYDAASKKVVDSTAFITDASSLNEAVVAIESYPDMTKEKFETLFNIAGKHVELSDIGFDRGTGVLSFSAKCGSAARVPVFISALRSSGIFSDVSYDGYAGATYTKTGEMTMDNGKMKTTQTTENEFSFNVVCTVSADESVPSSIE